MKNSISYYIIIVGLFLCICAPTLWSDGMFMDGLYYAAISRNLADGLGTFWYLHHTDFSHPIFHEHPPLAIGIQSIFFYLFGGWEVVHWIRRVNWNRFRVFSRP